MEKQEFVRTLFETYYPTLIQRAYRLTKDPELSQDLVQDTFVLAVDHWEQLSRHPAPVGWLTLTLFNLVRNHRRNLSRHACVSLEDVSQCLAARERHSVGELLPVQLPKEDRNLLIWRYEQQLGYPEMALRLGVSQHACRMRVSRALEKCRRLWSDGGKEGGEDAR